MREPKTKCTNCGTGILKRTADRNDGLCEPCHVKAAAIPPEGFAIPPDLALRLASLDRDGARYRKMAWRNGIDYLRGHIEKLEELGVLYREWSPRLREFAKQCRDHLPCPNDESLSIRDRAKQRIFEAALNGPPRTGDETTVAICRMPLIAMSVAKRLWQKIDEQVILLTAEEELRWDEMYSHADDCFEWIVHFWWSIDDSPQRTVELKLPDGRTFARSYENDVQDGESPWLVTIGHSYGPHFGAGHEELWAWDGQQARFVKTLGQWIS